jgi:hypothetical protein
MGRTIKKAKKAKSKTTKVPYTIQYYFFLELQLICFAHGMKKVEASSSSNPVVASGLAKVRKEISNLFIFTQPNRNSDACSKIYA